MTITAPENIPIELLDAHPQNPRLVQREDVIEAIRGSINGHGFDPAHALIVRPLGDRFQIISGHHRKEAAARAKLKTVVAWVREMDDDTAYMELVRSNAQSELTALERGLHVLGATEKGKHGKGFQAYATATGREVTSVKREAYAAEVFKSCNLERFEEVLEKHLHLFEIHSAPSWLRPALVGSLVKHGSTVEAVRKQVAGLKETPKPPEWADEAAIAALIVSGEMKPAEIDRMLARVEKAHATIERSELKADEFKSALAISLDLGTPSRQAEVMDICNQVESRQAAEIAEEQRKEAHAQKEQQNREARIASMRVNVSLEQWETLDAPMREMLLDTSSITVKTSFNKQENNEIEWAQWSWNPVTGCTHPCPYCYARDIANSTRMAQAYPNGFAPTFRPSSLLAPSNTKVPSQATSLVDPDTRYKNVFTCSMADLFGRWVPAEWINAVLASVRANPQWNFLFLTKFPQRFAEFDIPENAWMGTTVDLQARVKNAEKAFAKLKTGVRWLSVEPMLEPIKFQNLELFQWVVIGGASASSGTPEWKPPYDWVADLTAEATRLGVAVYHKTNLPGPRRLELPFKAPLRTDPMKAPDVFRYLDKKQAGV